MFWEQNLKNIKPYLISILLLAISCLMRLVTVFTEFFLFLSPWTCPSAMGIGSSPVYQNSNLSTWFWFSGSGRGCGAAKSGEWSRCSGKIVFVWAKNSRAKNAFSVHSELAWDGTHCCSDRFLWMFSLRHHSMLLYKSALPVLPSGTNSQCTTWWIF